MPHPVSTIEFRFDQEGFSKDGMLFQGPIGLLALPELGECFDLDRPLGIRGRVIRKEMHKTGRLTEVIIHCQQEKTGHAEAEHLRSFLQAVKALFL